MTLSLIGSVVWAITTVLVWIGLPGLFALMAVESFGIPPIPSEVILPFTGFLIAQGTLPFAGAVAVAIAGALVGAYAAYAVGRWGRHRITGIGLGRLRLEERHLDRVDGYFAHYGEVTVSVGRLVPIVRAYISYPAGTAEMKPIRFGVYTVIGSIPFTLALVYAGMVLRSNWTVVSSYFTYLDYPLIACLVVIVLLLGLEVAGVLAPGWPPRRAAHRTAEDARDPPAPPE